MSIEYIPGAEPLYVAGSDTGCLLLHGLGGGTTWDLKEFAEVLHRRTEMTIWLPALKGFGTRPEDLYEVTFDDWLADARAGIDRLKQECNRILVLGHSGGGLLALLLASERKAISAIITWATPIAVQYRLIVLLPFIMRIPLLRRVIPERYPTDPSGKLRAQGWVGYDWISPVVGLAARDGMKRVKKALADVTCPAFVVQGSEDKAISENSAEKIYEAIASKRKEIWIVEGAGHAIMNHEATKDELYARTIDFLESS
ncbi:MAG: alpha/beta fold hydrolase [Candidatus Thorarchaeota archaeon]|nr:MAG: alpha/beta fold hydrolase [Candidatus Thorarchaeota archaeon]